MHAAPAADEEAPQEDLRGAAVVARDPADAVVVVGCGSVLHNGPEEEESSEGMRLSHYLYLRHAQGLLQG